MKIAFDLDGVVRKGDLAFLKLCLELEKTISKDVLTLANMTYTEPLLNPFLFALADDEIYIVTNCLSEKSRQFKERWVNHFLGNRVKLITISVAANKWGKEYVDAVAKAKVEVMLKEGIEVYFDNDPAIIRVMRTLTDKIKFIKYGCWIEEFYDNVRGML